MYNIGGGINGTGPAAIRGDCPLGGRGRVPFDAKSITLLVRTASQKIVEVSKEK